ncbi:MAG: hypothetical protein RLZZ505_2757 [Verrucomicrobiota bacterium]|jgi:hypothetical protein
MMERLERISRELGSTGLLLERLLEGGSHSATTATQMVTSMLLAEWMAKGVWVPGDTPSFLLVNAGCDPDPCLSLPKATFFSDLPVQTPAPSPEPHAISYADAEATLKQLINKAAKSPGTVHGTSLEAMINESNSALWTKCQKIVFGSASTAYYGHQHPVIGLASSPRGCTALWVESQKQLSRLQEDLENPGSFFWKPWGHDAAFRRRSMETGVIGSVRPEQWTGSLVDAVIHSCAPIVFLPHVATDGSITFSDRESARLTGFPSSGDTCASSGVIVPSSRRIPALFRLYEAAVRHRLQNLPPEFEFHIRSLMRHLLSRTVTLVEKLRMPLSGEPLAEWSGTMILMTYEAALRGITFGVEALVYHLYGLPMPEEDLEILRRFLGYIRQQGNCSRRDLSRKFQTVSTPTRDVMLAVLEREGLVALEGQKVAAISCREFFASLPNRPLVPQPTDWEKVRAHASKRKKPRADRKR